MTNSPPLKTRMLCLSEVLQTFFQTVHDNKDEMTGILLKLKELRREHVQFLCKEVVEKFLEEQGKRLSQEDTIEIVEKMIASSREQQQKSYRLIEEVIWKEFLENIGTEALEKKLPQIVSLTSHLETTASERDSLISEKAKLQQALREQGQQCEKLQKQVAEFEAKVGQLVQENEKLKDIAKSREDYENILRKIRKELDAKKEMDMWRLKVFYNRVASLTGSEWSYPGVPKPDPFVPESKEAKHFLETLE